ncbi:MAG: transglycosylase SLT domain-containing protein, partial [Myxococcaceae bacterium]
GAEALLLTADLAKEKKDSAGELAALLQLWGKHPLSTLSEPAEARIKGIKKGSITPEATIWRAEALIDSHRNKQGMALLAPLLPLLKLPDPLACKAHFLNGKALRKERKHSQAVTSLVPVVTKCTDPDLRARAMYVLGSSQSIVDLDRGAKTYEGLAHEFPTHSFADDALFYAADLYVKLGELDAAMKTLTELAEKYPGGDFAAVALFKRFWIQRERGQTDEAVKTLELLRKSYREAEESYEYERATYWLGRMHEKSDPKAAVALFQEVAVDHPATYYGLIARDRIAALDNDAFNKLGQKLAFPEAGAPVWPLFAGPLGDDPHFRAGVELYRLGLTEAVTSELLAANRTNQPPEAVRLLVQILSLSGDARSAHAVARVSLRRDLSGRISPENRFVWEVAYPRAFRDSIEEHCKSAGFDPDLLQALMREESALDPKALSWAGALGLTQLMPSTAIQVAHSLKLKTPSTAALLEPALNIRLGASYLGTLLKQWKGNKQYALGSYNAGAKAVQKWRDDNPKLELDEWVEEIPIAETRGYVKRVLRSYNTYQLLYPTRPPVKTASNSAERK